MQFLTLLVTIKTIGDFVLQKIKKKIQKKNIEKKINLKFVLNPVLKKKVI